MSLYLFRFKLSNDAFAAYVKEPSHRESAARNLIEAAGGITTITALVLPKLSQLLRLTQSQWQQLKW